MKFGEKLRQIRLERSLSQEELATVLGTSKQVISRYEKDQRTPKITVAQEYAEKLGLPLDFLVDDNQDTPKEKPTTVAGDELDALDRQLMEFVSHLSLEQKQFLLAQLQTMLAQNTKTPPSPVR